MNADAAREVWQAARREHRTAAAPQELSSHLRKYELSSLSYDNYNKFKNRIRLRAPDDATTRSGLADAGSTLWVKARVTAPALV